MNVLVGCEYTGVVREAFKAKGHYAVSCDLLDTEIPGMHIKADIFRALLYNDWDLIILFPPCTKIDLSGNRWYGYGMPKHDERLEAEIWTKELWETACRLCDKVSLENPKNVMGMLIGKRTQAIHPYQFGHPEQKETWLWLKNLPSLRETDNVYDAMMRLPVNERERVFYMSRTDNRGLERSRTFPGIARAMADQWGNL